VSRAPVGARVAKNLLVRVAFVVLLVWLTWPIVELFDNWDKPVDTGNDTQYSFIVLGLCAGLAYLSSRRRHKFSPPKVVQVVAKSLRALVWIAPFVSFLHWAPDSPSPPLSLACPFAVLRI